MNVAASTSEIFSVVGRTWSGTNLPSEISTGEKEREGAEPAVKSEFGVGSEESGYGSVKTDDNQIRIPYIQVNLSLGRHQNQSLLQEDSDLATPLTTKWTSCMDTSDLPSDLSLHTDKGDTDIVAPANMYKFKSNIRQR